MQISLPTASGRLVQPALVSLLLALAALVGCKSSGGESGEAGESGESGESPLTYYGDVQPLIAMHCGACHVEGGVGPLDLSTYEQLVELSSLVEASIVSGAMPPWQPDPECRSFERERRLSEADEATVLAWIEQGMVEGDPADAQPIEPPKLDLEEVSIIARSVEPYTPELDTPDDYHCLVMDIDFSEPTFLSAYQVVPDERAIVHHIIFYLVPANGAAALTAADAATPEPGYECFGSSGHGGQPMGVWAPGGLPVRFPQDSAFVIEPGAKLVAQMHYYAVGAEPGPDQTELHLALLPSEPALRVTMPILSGFFDIPAGDPAYTAEFTVDIDDPQPRQIFSVMPHMHLLGEVIDLRRERDGEETCIARINDWDFNWQQFYDLREQEFVEVRAGDTLRYSCTYDNSAENQPIVDGQQQPPGPVAVGEGTLDEMCLHVVAMVEPYEETAPGTPCAGLGQCYEQSCDPADGLCFLGCGAAEADGCGECLLPAINACGQKSCPAEATAVVACLGQSCQADFTDIEAIQGCLANECQAQFEASWACMYPHLLAGECDDEFGPCGL